eukprot:219927-Amphidinium_carterae.1
MEELNWKLTQQAQSAGSGSNKVRAVGGDRIPWSSNWVQTAKALVGMDSKQRRVEATQNFVMLVPETHPYLQCMQAAGKE